MKTEDFIQLGALAAIGFLLYQKFAPAKSPSVPSLPVQPSTQLPDFGLPPNSGWGDNGGNMALQNMIDWAV
jgi:hypothetical protein